MKKKYDIVVFGATGFTGSLICEYLNTHSDIKGTNWAIAGKNRSKVNALKEKYSVDGIIAESFNKDSLDNMCSLTSIVISVVGPYDIYGEKLVDSCISNGTHYLDLTGEPSFVKKIYNKYSDLSKEARVIIMHCCGFESIPPDLGAYLTVKELDSENIDLKYYLKSKGKISGGTWASFVNSLNKPTPIIDRNTKKSKKHKKLFYSKRFNRWALLFPVIDKYIVMKSSRRFKDNYGKNFNFTEYILLPSLVSAILLVGGIVAISLISKISYFKQLILSFIPSGNGPNEKERASNWFTCTLIGSDKNSEVTTIIKGGDPGYGDTSKFISEMALCILLQKDELLNSAGILTPVECTGELMYDRLINAKISINTSKTAIKK